RYAHQRERSHTMNVPTVAGSSAPEFLTVEEAAAILRVNRKTLYESIRLGQVPGVVRVGKSLRIRRAALVGSSSGKGRDSDDGKRR
ncbi:helix-turn-helix domain-containing protein, partial [Corallococcus exiguus]